MLLTVAYIDNVIYQWCLEEPVQLDLIVFNDILSQCNSFSKQMCVIIYRASHTKNKKKWPKMISNKKT